MTQITNNNLNLTMTEEESDFSKVWAGIITIKTQTADLELEKDELADLNNEDVGLIKTNLGAWNNRAWAAPGWASR
ncbi:MAG: hypothetical protein K2X27_15840 [Candidatus Obscuribacterales bacterium]|nr:hypothetical protein [Candidatus Obscuribacterales bacterium]